MSVNERLQDAAIAHAVNLQRYDNGVVRRIIATLNKADRDLAAALSDALERLPAESFTVERLEVLLDSVRRLNAEAYRRVDAELSAELKEFASYESQYQLELFKRTVPAQVQVHVGITGVNAEAVYTAALARPFQGRLLREWAAGIEANRMLRIRDAVRMGYVEGQTNQQIVQRIIGTRAKKYADGLFDGDRRSVERVVRTAMGHMAAVTRARFDEANEDLIKGYRWLSTLDSRTTRDLCAPRDGKLYTLDHKPIGHSIPWGAGPSQLHWNCRSSSTRILKSLRELGLDSDDFKASTRASMDGQVPAETTYGQWLKGQSAARQDEILGPTRGRLMRQGGLSMDKFYNDKGRWLNLTELRKTESTAFDKAGLE